MEIIANAVVKFFDLVEAEGRVFRQKALVMMEGVIMMWLGAALFLCGLLAAVAALYMWLSGFIGKPFAALVVAVALCASGTAFLKKGSEYSQDGSEPHE